MEVLIGLSALFLLLLAGLAFASVKLFGARDAQGQLSAPGCAGGCLMAGVLSLMALLGLIAFIAGATAMSASRSASELLSAAPDMKVGVWRDRGAHVESVPGYPLRVVLQWSGHSEPTEALLRALEEAGAGGEMQVEVRYDTGPDGAPLTIVDLALPAAESDADELERVLSEVLPELSLSEGIEIRLRGVESDEEMLLEDESEGQYEELEDPTPPDAPTEPEETERAVDLRDAR